MAEYGRNCSEHFRLKPVDHWAFISIMTDVLRLPHETLAMAFLYVNKFVKFCSSSEVASPLDDYVRPQCFYVFVIARLSS